MNNQNLSASRVFEYISTLEESKKSLELELQRVKENSINASDFDKSYLTVESVALMHNVTTQTVRKYIRYGVIDEHPNSMPSKVLIRTSDALRINFKELKRNLKYGIIKRK